MDTVVINHSFTVTQQEPSNAYSASSGEFLPRDDTNTIVLPMTSINAIRHHSFRKSFPHYTTCLPIYHRSTDIPESPVSYIAVGVRTGQPLQEWIRTLTRGNIWEYDGTTNPKTLSDLRTVPKKIVCLLGAALAPIHENGKYVGDILNLARVEPDFSRITFDNTMEHTGGAVEGIKKDLADFRSLITSFETSERISYSQKISFKALLMFNRLCDDAKKINTLPELREISYFICYNPISWGFEQRVSFMFTFYSFRERNTENHPYPNRLRRAFDGVLKLDTYPTEFPKWEKFIPAGSVFEQVFTDSKHNLSFTASSTSGLMNYHRACLLHYHDKEKGLLQSPTPFTTIDRHLNGMFPFALPMVWYAFYRGRNDLPTQGSCCGIEKTTWFSLL